MPPSSDQAFERGTAAGHDVVVTGAGTAGAATAMLLARRGLRVLLLDHRSSPTRGPEPAVLTRAGVLLLSRWGVLDAVCAAGTRPVRRTTFRYGDETVSISVKAVLGIDALYAPRRVVLERVLLGRALEAGAALCPIQGIVALVVRRDRVAGVHARTPDGQITQIPARLVVGADGVASTVADLAGAAYSRVARHPIALTYGYWSGLATDAYEWTFGPNGRAAVIPTGDDEAYVCASAAPERIGRGGVRVIAEHVATGSRQLAEQLASASPAPGIHSWPGRRGHVRAAHGPGWALVGAAGHFKDPSSVHGSTDGFRDAELLADAVARGFGDDAHLDEALAGYEAARDRFGVPIFDLVDRIAAGGRDGGGTAPLLQQLSSAMAEEVEMLARLETCPLGPIRPRTRRVTP